MILTLIPLLILVVPLILTYLSSELNLTSFIIAEGTKFTKKKVGPSADPKEVAKSRHEYKVAVGGLSNFMQNYYRGKFEGSLFTHDIIRENNPPLHVRLCHPKNSTSFSSSSSSELIPVLVWFHECGQVF